MKFADDSATGNIAENKVEKGASNDAAHGQRLFEEAYDNKAAGSGSKKDVDAKNGMGKQTESDESSSLKKIMPKESIDGIKKGPDNKAVPGESGDSKPSIPNQAVEPGQKFLDIPPLGDKCGLTEKQKAQGYTAEEGENKANPSLDKYNHKDGAGAVGKDADKSNDGLKKEHLNPVLKKGEAIDSLSNR